jgi:Na+-transporting NADH:ubiquinone oxidoreductase subunit C
MHFSARYTIFFAALLCTVCSIVVSAVSVSVHDRQEANRRLLGQGRQLLTVAGLVEADEDLSREDIAERVFRRLEPRIVDLRTGAYSTDGDAAAFDQRQARNDPEASHEAPDNPAGVTRLPHRGQIFLLRRDGDVEALVLPIEGQGIFSTMYGYIALDADARTIRGVTFYEHAETPGLGAEIDNPGWKELWRGRLAFDDKWAPAVRVAKGAARPPAEDPYRIDGIAGATITCDGVTNLIHFWLGDHGFGPYLDAYRRGER